MPDKFPRRAWTAEEVEILKEMYPIHGADVSKWEKKIEKSRNAIYSKVDKLGLCRYDIETGISEEQRVLLAKAFVAVCKRIGIDVHRAIREINQLKRRRLI
jgi:hypothetical protein